MALGMAGKGDDVSAEPAPSAVVQAQPAIPKKGPRTPARLEARLRMVQKSNEDPGSAVKVTPTCR